MTKSERLKLSAEVRTVIEIYHDWKRKNYLSRRDGNKIFCLALGGMLPDDLPTTAEYARHEKAMIAADPSLDPDQPYGKRLVVRHAAVKRKGKR